MRHHRKAKDEGTNEAAKIIIGMAAEEEGGNETNMAAEIFDSPFLVLSE